MFAFATVVVVTGEFSAPAGGVALALLMLPTILLTAEEAIKRVPVEDARSGDRNGRDADAGCDQSDCSDRLAGHR